MARQRRRASLLLSTVAVVAVTGYVSSHRPPGETEAPHAAKDLGVKVVTHEQATAELDQMLTVLTDFIPIHLGEVDTEYKDDCIVGNTNVSNGARDFSSQVGKPVENFEDYSRRFVDHVKALGYKPEAIWPGERREETWFTYRNSTGTLVEVALYPDRSTVMLYSRCYEYDWPELTPTPTPSVTPDG